MDNLEFSEEEIQQQLELLGYKNISKEKLQEFKKGTKQKRRVHLRRKCHNNYNVLVKY